MLISSWAVAVTLALQSNVPPPAPPPEPARDRPLTHIIQNLGHDVVALPSLRSAKILLVGTFLTLVARPSDHDFATRALNAGESSMTSVGSIAGEGWVQAGAAVATYAIGALGHHRRVAHIGSDLIRAQFLNGLITNGLKFAFNRERPTGSDYAFPSGHVSATFVTAAVIDGHFGWKAGLPMYALASYVGWTRVRDRDHWLSDVVFGSTLGILVGRTVTGGHGANGWTVIPTPTRGGFAIYVTRIAR